MQLSRLVGAVAILAAIAYPALVYVGLSRWSPRLLAIIIISMAIATTLFKLADPRGRANVVGIIAVPICVVALALCSAVLRSHLFLLLTPVLISVALLLTFGLTLRSGRVSMIERFARLQDPDLTADKIEWCRSTTVIWCGFFVINGAAAAGLALWAPLSWWTLYTGIGAYVMMGILFVGEILLRRIRFGSQGNA